MFALGSIIVKLCRLINKRCWSRVISRLFYRRQKWDCSNTCHFKSRVEGAVLNVAWPYLSPTQKSSFKKQTRKRIHKFSTVKFPTTALEPIYIVPDPNPIADGDISSSDLWESLRQRSETVKLYAQQFTILEYHCSEWSNCGHCLLGACWLV